jgi:uncharacterized protein (DUF488 family)
MINQSADRTVFTIGHSTRTMDEFILLLKSQDVELVVDVRTIPKSRHNPQYNTTALIPALGESGINYQHMKGLGGLRHAKRDSINIGWKNFGFRGYADYMQTKEFEKNILDLIETAGQMQSAVMCAEAVPWRCHRSLISDALLIRGVKVIHIISATSNKEHSLTPWAEVKGMTIIYPKQQLQRPDDMSYNREK